MHPHGSVCLWLVSCHGLCCSTRVRGWPQSALSHTQGRLLSLGSPSGWCLLFPLLSVLCVLNTAAICVSLPAPPGDIAGHRQSLPVTSWDTVCPGNILPSSQFWWAPARMDRMNSLRQRWLIRQRAFKARPLLGALELLCSAIPSVWLPISGKWLFFNSFHPSPSVTLSRVMGLVVLSLDVELNLPDPRQVTLTVKWPQGP